MLNGHGTNDSINGHANEILLSSKDSINNQKLTKNKIIYIRSCSSGAILGPACIKAECNVFIGYVKEFAIIRSKSKVSRPLEDERAKPFLTYQIRYLLQSLEEVPLKKQLIRQI